MSTPNYKGPGQPMPSANDGITGWLGGFLGGSAAPAYKSAPTAPPAPPPCPPCPPFKQLPESTQAPSGTNAPKPAPVEQSEIGCAIEQTRAPFICDEHSDIVVPVGNGPITIVIQPRA